MNDSVVMGLDIESEAPTLYEQPSEYKGKVALIEFAVTPGGRLWYLDEMKEGGHTAFGFDSHGEVSSRTQVDTPPGLLVTRFAVSEDASLLVGGFFLQDAPKDLRGKGYLALFGRSGVLTKEIGREILPNVDLEVFAKGKFVEGAVTTGADGNFYVLSGNEIMVLSEAGDVIRRISFKRPELTDEVDRIDLSDGLLSIEFLTPSKEDPWVLHAQFLVLNSATGEPFALYRPSKELGDVCVCFSRTDGYLFSRIDKGKIQLVTAPLR